MGYIENNLMRGEQIIYVAKLHAIVYVPPIFIMLITIALCCALPADAAGIVGLAVFTICVMWCVEIHGGRQFVLTNKRVIEKRGIINRKVNELMLRKCEGIQVEQSIVGRMLNYGTVLVTTGEATNHYRKILNPVRFSTLINEQIDGLKGTP